ncbi:MarR family transcriptional regulator [Microbacterium sp. H1-D42]|uniref:MarR family winged helix-turn-helix transcriptional regulator n=1 Tax=Microbacterium sp. H1-D42 TaxID=2925844 RepID=UPI001F53324C|nr:MarR family transcriptional regulator [Microbacterium sp. H1-D42]UNK69496.1 MarR family transcriptional regulator [Microbacterium sp. H1-D42]
MQNADAIGSIVLSAHSLARIAAQDSGNEAPSAQWRALSTLAANGEMRLGALAASARTTQPGMTRLVGALEQAGLVSRSPDPDDSRATLVAATEAGIQALNDWRTELRDTLAPRFADLSDQDWAALHRAAEILAAHTQNTNSINTTTGARA